MRPMVRRSVVAVVAASTLATAFSVGVFAGIGSVPKVVSPAALGPLEEAADQISQQSLRPVDRGVLSAAAIQGMLTAAGDQWGSWSSDGSAGTDDYVGVGVWLRSDAGQIVIAQVTGGSPAAKAGLQAGDQVMAVAGRVTQGSTAPIVAAGLRGRAGSSVAVLYQRGATSQTVVLTRASVPAAGVTVVREPVAVKGRQVARIVIPSFTRGVGREVRAALTRLRAEQISGVVLDLRGDPGGLLDEAVETASVFLNGGVVVTYARRDGPTQQLNAVGTGDTLTPLVVLVDGGTASAAEVVAGALQDRGRAVIVGSRTFGKGSVQEPRTLSDGSALELTVARYTTPTGRSLEGVGLEPDITVAPGSDPAVAQTRAVEVLTGLSADATTTGGRG